ncbi:MAG: sigma-70 family RNA polymerase sigma factor [Bryobacterales bacterium]|nr:sigma-70 family RNA polymerase sigma factor [Bryobacterales bacterium]
MSPGLSRIAPEQAASPDWAAIDWVRLVASVRSGEKAGMEQLYGLFVRGIRFYLCRQLGTQDVEDKVHDTFVVVVEAIRSGELRDPNRLMGFVRTVVRRQVAAYITEAVTGRERLRPESEGTLSSHDVTPEEAAIESQQEEIMARILRGIPSRDREILTRFYLLEQPQHQICSEMNLTETQFRLLKSRAKARFGELGKKRLASQKFS